MQPSLQKFPRTSQKVSNILVRHTYSTEVKYNGIYQNPEAPYMMKYAPKYYHSLTLEVTSQSSLLSKAKKIKKLKKFRGLFKDPLPQKLWFNLLENTRKEIEELPLIICTRERTKLSQSFWTKLNLQKIKSFSNVKKILLPKYKIGFFINDNNGFLPIRDCVKYLCNMRSLKSLKIAATDHNYDQAEWFVKELNGKNKVLDRLEILSIDISDSGPDMEELLFQNKRVLSHLTGLSLSDDFDPDFAGIPQVCKNLKSLSLRFDNSQNHQPEFLDLLASIHRLEKLVNLELDLINDVPAFWSHFKPPSCLRSLTLKCCAYDMVPHKSFEVDMATTLLLRHWEDIEDLDHLEFEVNCDNSQDILLAKSFVTKALKKVRKLRALKVHIPVDFFDKSLTYGPFEIEEVAHLYESLEKFEFQPTYEEDQIDETITLNLEKMKSFRNLKEVKIEGGVQIVYEDIEEIVDILQEKSDSLLKVKMDSVDSPKRLKEILKKIAKGKRMDRNWKMNIHLKFDTYDPVGLLDKLCEIIEPARTIKGLEIYLDFFFEGIDPQILTERLRENFEKYSKIRNLMVSIGNHRQRLEYIRRDGEKEQFYICDHF